MAANPLTPEILVPRLGDYLVQKGHITGKDLKTALAYQDERKGDPERPLLGQVLLELKMIDRRTLDAAITEQIIQLRNALEDANRNLEQRVRERTAELQEALRKLSELNQMKANFVANVSHELRTPLTHVKGYLELLATASLGDVNEEQKSALEISQRSVARLEGLINSLIMFALAARGEMTLHLAPVNLNRIAEKVMNLSRPKAEDRKVSLEEQVQPGLPEVKADEEKISWAILQLLDNAIKFTPAEGRVVLSIRPDTDMLVKASVSDTGIGIPPERLGEIFEPFHQLDASSKRSYGGTGLGLALTQEILHAHGSKIEVHSEAGKGSTFSFPLLVAEKPTEAG